MGVNGQRIYRRLFAYMMKSGNHFAIDKMIHFAYAEL